MAKQKPDPKIAKRIRDARLKKKLTHAALAKASGLSLDTIHKLQAGDRGLSGRLSSWSIPAACQRI